MPANSLSLCHSIYRILVNILFIFGVTVNNLYGERFFFHFEQKPTWFNYILTFFVCVRIFQRATKQSLIENDWNFHVNRLDESVFGKANQMLSFVTLFRKIIFEMDIFEQCVFDVGVRMSAMCVCVWGISFQVDTCLNRMRKKILCNRINARQNSERKIIIIYDDVIDCLAFTFYIYKLLPTISIQYCIHITRLTHHLWSSHKNFPLFFLFRQYYFDVI